MTRHACIPYLFPIHTESKINRSLKLKFFPKAVTEQFKSKIEAMYKTKQDKGQIPILFQI